jgi:F-type H+-transporting ATPase subunit alpha
LLERAAKLSAEKGGGSITALPIVETQAGDISAYIPTNVISITDGQVFLDSELFSSGFRPAIDVGLSVSRVGGAAQTKAVKKVAGRLRIDLAQYREMAAFSQFGSDLDKATQDKLSQGQRLMEVLKQGRFLPFHMEEECALLSIATKGFLKTCPVELVSVFIADFLDFLRSSHPKVLNNIAQSKDLDAETDAELNAAAASFVEDFVKAHPPKKQ